MKKLNKLRSLTFLVLAFLTWSVVSCSKTSSTDPTATIELSQTTSTLTVGDEITLIPTFTPSVSKPNAFKWKVGNGQIVALTINSDHSATIVAKTRGATTVSITSSSGEVLASCQITIHEPVVDDGILKILAIGNSFSEDALEHYLHGLAEAAGKKIVIGNLYIGGSALQEHHTNATNNSAAYDYRKINLEGGKSNQPNTSIATALADENWDYISFQQASPNSGQYNTFTGPLPPLYNYVKGKMSSPAVKYIIHQTWAYAQNSTHAGFSNYANNQQTMYQAIVGAYNQAKTLITADLLVPVGTAIQNGRTSVIGDNFCRDGYHLDLNIGRYTASSTWFEALFGETVIGNTYKPAALTDYETEIAQHAAHLAILNPNAVTVMTEYQGGGSNNLINPVLVNFGTNTSNQNWNTLTGFLAESALPSLKDEAGNYTGISLKITERFNGINPDGAAATTTSFTIPSNISKDSYFGNAQGVFDGSSTPKSVVKFEGLDKTKKYNFCFFASRAGVTDNRETKYILKGLNEGTGTLDASNNSSNTACINNIQPDANGAITLTVTAGDRNTNGSKFFYINALRLTMGEN